MHANYSSLAPKTTKPTLLAQIPDLNARPRAAEQGEQDNGGSDGRLISQSLSLKLLLGGGILLVLAALAPFALRKGESKPAAKDQAGQSASATSGSDSANGGDLSQSNSPSPAAPGASPHSETNPTPAAWLQPQAGANRPMALGDPSDARPNDRLGSPAERQADSRSDPAGDYRTARADRDYRSDYPGSGNPLMPAPVSNASQDVQPAEPGVARFEGTIERPPLRNDYERAGSSIH